MRSPVCTFWNIPAECRHPLGSPASGYAEDEAEEGAATPTRCLLACCMTSILFPVPQYEGHYTRVYSTVLWYDGPYNCTVHVATVPGYPVPEVIKPRIFCTSAASLSSLSG